MNKKDVIKEINAITELLIGKGLSDQFNFVSESENMVCWSSYEKINIAMKNIEYHKIYEEISKKKNYNFKMPDGGIIQMMYEFDQNGLLKHRLAFFPSPNFEEYQNAEDYYEEDSIYGDIIDKKVLPVIIRFDYCRELVESDIHHPYSHLTLGQYKNCRIPLTGPMSPTKFMDFILENFYYLPKRDIMEKELPVKVEEQIKHIHDRDLSKVHLVIGT